MNYYCPPKPPYGKERRAAIKAWFNDPENVDGELCVNTKYRPQIKTDPDLRRLIKDGFLKAIRYGMPRSRKTFLVKVI